MNDIWLYIIIFALGAVVALIDSAARAVDCKVNKKLWNIFPLRHIPTLGCVILALSAFVHYGLNPETGRATSISILSVALGFLAVTVAIDLVIIFFLKKK